MEVLARNQDIIEQSLERAAEVMDDFSGSVKRISKENTIQFGD